MSDKLKPCPFCGGEAELRVVAHIPSGYDYTPRCRKPSCCGRLTKKFNCKETAVTFWNTRKSVDAVLNWLEDEKLRYFLTISNTGDEKNDSIYEAVGNVIDKALEIIREGRNDNQL